MVSKPHGEFQCLSRSVALHPSVAASVLPDFRMNWVNDPPGRARVTGAVQVGIWRGGQRRSKSPISKASQSREESRACGTGPVWEIFAIDPETHAAPSIVDMPS
jgi:hypothetical protein